MRNLNKLKFLLLSLLSLSLCECVSSPPDVPVFEYLQQHLGTDPVTTHIILEPSPACMAQIQEPECGHGVYILSGKEIYIGETHTLNGKKWSELKASSVYMPAKEAYAPLQTYIINSCNQAHCNDQVDRFRVKLNSLNGIQSLLGKP